MLIEAIFFIAVLCAGLIVVLDRVMYPRHSRLFRSKPRLVRISQSLFPVLLAVFLIRSFTFEAFSIPSGSMKPTLVEGDLVVVDKFSLGLRLPILGYRLSPGRPDRGDIVVFRGEVDGKNAGIIKRIVGLPGDHIKYKNRTLYINNKPATQIDLASDTDILINGNKEKVIRATEVLGDKAHPIFMSLHDNITSYPFDEIVVPKNSYFVLGDHRNNSLDSRYWGVLADSKLIGKARFVALSIDLPHKSIRWQRIGKIS